MTDELYDKFLDEQNEAATPVYRFSTPVVKENQCVPCAAGYCGHHSDLTYAQWQKLKRFRRRLPVKPLRRLLREQTGQDIREDLSRIWSRAPEES